MNSKGKTERLKAYHEAGHAVMAQTLGLAMVYVTVLSTDDMTAASTLTRSATSLARYTDQAMQLTAHENDMKVCLAGPHAEERYQPSNSKSIPNQWASDFELAKSFAAKAVLIKRGRRAEIQIGEGSFEVSLDRDEHAEFVQLFNRISAETKALIAKLWPAITRVAEELLRRRTLFGNEVEALIADRPLAAEIGRDGQQERGLII
jgi:ATP-dependent Zn protease